MNEKRRFFPKNNWYKLCLILMGLVTMAFLLALILVDTLPTDLTFILVGLVFALLIFTCTMFASRHKWKRIVGILVSLIFFVLFISITSYMGSTYAMFNKISKGGIEASGPKAKNVDVTEKAFNVYVTGIDQWEEEKGKDLERSDVNMIVTVNPQTKQILLTSIPRDSYIKLHTAQQMDKLTHTGIYGVEETLRTVEDWMGIDLNYYVKMNFTAVRDIINAMGGIRVYSPVAFDSSLRDYHYEKGWNELGGRQALFFARERHAFEDEDEMRVENQQRVMKGIIEKMTSSTTLLTKYGDIMDAAGDNLTTNMSSEYITDLVRMQITELSGWKVKTQKLKGDYGQEHVASLSSKNKYSVFLVDDKSLKDSVTAIKETEKPLDMDRGEAIKGRSKSFVVNLVKRLSEQIEDMRSKKEKDK